MSRIPHFVCPAETRAQLAAKLTALRSDIAAYAAGRLAADALRPKRVLFGVYEQRDGRFMVRVRIPGGVLALHQATALADAAELGGTATLHVTTRQDVQLHALDLALVPQVMERLLEDGLSPWGGGGNGVRNITACPLAGVCPGECFNILPYVHAFTGYFLQLPEAWSLPRKFKIAFSGCSADCGGTGITDVGFVARLGDGNSEPGFAVLAGGGLGARSRSGVLIDSWVPASAALVVAEAVRRVFFRLGDRSNRHRARLRFVVDRLGEEGFRREVRAEIAKVRVDEGVPRLPDPERTHSCASRGFPTPEFAGGVWRYAERDPAHVTMEIHPPLGLLTTADLRSLAALAGESSAYGVLRTTCEQSIMIPGVSRDKADELAARLRSAVPARTQTTPLCGFRTCAGADTCKLGFCRSRDAARACAAALAEAGLSPEVLGAARIVVSGCPNACSRHPAAVLGFHGTARKEDGRLVPAYVVVAGARRADGVFHLARRVGVVPARRLPGLVVAFVRAVAETARKRRERFEDAALRPEMQRLLAKLVRRRADFPAFAAAPDFFRDFGADSWFDIPRKRIGECAAELDELVKERLETAKRLLERGDAAADTNALYSAAEAVLLASGCNPGSPEETERFFREWAPNFVDLPRGARVLLEVRSWRPPVLSPESAARAAAALLDCVSAAAGGGAQKSMPRKPDAADRTVSAAGAEIDLRGVPCPLNFARVKVALDGLDRGAKLVMLLDDGEPVRRVAQSLQLEGHAIEESKRTDEGWRLVAVRGAVQGERVVRRGSSASAGPAARRPETRTSEKERRPWEHSRTTH